MITCLLTSTHQPSQLTLSSLEFHLHHVWNMVTILLNEVLSTTISSKDWSTNPSDTGENPVVVSQVILITICSLKDTISLSQTQASWDPYLFHSLHDIRSTSIICKGEGREGSWRGHDEGERRSEERSFSTPRPPFIPQRTNIAKQKNKQVQRKSPDL